MRVVSWIVVASSVIWLAASAFLPFSSFPGLPPVDPSQVSGSTVFPSKQSFDAETFALRYTEAWNSRNPQNVAAFYAPDGSISINGEEPYVGTKGVTQMASAFITTFPDIEVAMVDLEQLDARVVFNWTFTGTHFETGQHVLIHGSETWLLNEQGLIERSIGQFDAEEYDRQVAGGTNN